MARRALQPLLLQLKPRVHLGSLLPQLEPLPLKPLPMLKDPQGVQPQKKMVNGLSGWGHAPTCPRQHFSDSVSWQQRRRVTTGLS